MPVSPGDSGTAIGAAAYALSQQKVPVIPRRNPYLGPRYTTERCLRACEQHREKPIIEILENPSRRAAQLLGEGKLVGWFQNRMEFGPRALGNRSILANPFFQGAVEEVNKKIKFREGWRSFSPSLLDSLAQDFLQTKHPADYMSMSFDVNQEWQERVPGLVYQDGTSRAQVVTRAGNPRYHRLLREFAKISGYGIVLNTSLNRPGEALVCSPEDALNLFFGSDLEYLIMQRVLVTKRPELDWER